MTEREQFIEDWRAIISGLLPHLTPEEVEAKVQRCVEREYGSQTFQSGKETESTT